MGSDKLTTPEELEALLELSKEDLVTRLTFALGVNAGRLSLVHELEERIHELEEMVTSWEETNSVVTDRSALWREIAEDLAPTVKMLAALKRLESHQAFDPWGKDSELSPDQLLADSVEPIVMSAWKGFGNGRQMVRIRCTCGDEYVTHWNPTGSKAAFPTDKHRSCAVWPSGEHVSGWARLMSEIATMTTARAAS